MSKARPSDEARSPLDPEVAEKILDADFQNIGYQGIFPERVCDRVGLRGDRGRPADGGHRVEFLAVVVRAVVLIVAGMGSTTDPSPTYSPFFRASCHQFSSSCR